MSLGGSGKTEVTAHDCYTKMCLGDRFWFILQYPSYCGVVLVMQLLVHDGKKEAGPAAVPTRVIGWRRPSLATNYSRRFLLLKLCAVLLVLVLVLVLVFVGVTIYHKAKHPEVCCHALHTISSLLLTYVFSYCLLGFLNPLGRKKVCME